MVQKAGPKFSGSTRSAGGATPNSGRVTKSSKDSNQLKKLNQYTMQRMLGQGAYGQVFVASDERGETVAIKVINKSLSLL